MPLATAGSRGYADYQRIGNFDSGQLGAIFTTSNVNQITPVIDVGRYEYVALQVTCGLNPYLVRLHWYLDAATSIPVGTRTFQLTNIISGALQARFVNLGPFVQVETQPIGGLNSNIGVQVFGSNRSHPLELVPTNPVLVDQQAVAIGAGVTATIYPSDYYAGPVQVGVWINQSGGPLNFEYLSFGGTWDVLQQMTLPTSTWETVMFVMPTGAWRFRLPNGVTPASYYLTATPTTTGAT